MLKNTMDVFLILGHGLDNTLQREEEGLPELIVPPGITLVTFAECGNNTYTSSDKAFANLFTDKDALAFLQDPVKYKSEIEKKLGLSMRVYREGMEMPDLTLYPLAIFNEQTKNGIPGAKIKKSGVYKAPLELEDKGFPYRVSALFFFPKDITFAYKDSLLPTEDEVQKFYKQKKYSLTAELPTIPIQSILKNPGIYYWKICRAAGYPGMHSFVKKEIDPYKDYIEELERQLEEAKQSQLDPTISEIVKEEELSPSIGYHTSVLENLKKIRSRSTQRQRKLFEPKEEPPKGGKKRKHKKTRRALKRI